MDIKTKKPIKESSSSSNSSSENEIEKLTSKKVINDQKYNKKT